MSKICLFLLPGLLLISLPLLSLSMNGFSITTPSKLPEGTSASASGPQSMQYKGYRVSDILNEISDVPVDYRLRHDPRVNFEYAFTKNTAKHARDIAITSLLNYVEGRTECVAVLTPGLFLEATDNFGRKAADEVVGRVYYAR